MPLGSQPAASRQPLDATLASASASAVPIGSSSGSTVGGGLIPIRDEQFAAYLKEVEDAFYFMKEFLANLYGEANRLDTELDTMMVPSSPPFPFLLILDSLFYCALSVLTGYSQHLHHHLAVLHRHHLPAAHLPGRSLRNELPDRCI